MLSTKIWIPPLSQPPMSGMSLPGALSPWRTRDLRNAHQWFFRGEPPQKIKMTRGVTNALGRTNRRDRLDETPIRACREENMKNWFLTALAASAVMLIPVAFAFDIGPAVGSQIPAFIAHDAQGKTVQWSDLAGEKGTVLVFFRSAKWCPYCQAQLISLKDAAAPLQQRGYRLAAISYDAPEVLADFIKRRAIPYTLLSDDKSAMIDAFKLRDPQYKSDSMAFGVPQPSIFIISSGGVMQAKLAEEGYKTRPPVDVVLKAVDAVLAGQH